MVQYFSHITLLFGIIVTVILIGLCLCVIPIIIIFIVNTPVYQYSYYWLIVPNYHRINYLR